MDGEGTGEGTGTIQDGGSTEGAGGAGGGSGPDKPGATGGGSGAAGGTGTQAFDRGKLHPALRDMSPTEITELFETMATSLRTVQRQPTGEVDASGIPAHARPVEKKVPEPLSKDAYKKLLDPNSEE